MTGTSPGSAHPAASGSGSRSQLLRGNVGRHLDLPSDQLREGAVREVALELRGDLGVPADQVTVLRLLRADRLADHLGDLLRRDAPARGLAQDFIHSLELLAVEALRRRRELGLLLVDRLGPLAPDRGVDAAGL